MPEPQEKKHPPNDCEHVEKQDDQYDFWLALVKPLSEWLQAFDAKDSDLADQDD